MARVKGDCGHLPPDSERCWHGICRIVKRFRNGRFLLMNTAGHVQVVDAKDVLYGA